MSNPVIQTQGLTKRFGKKTAVNQVNLQIMPGQVYGFLGPNGAGKSTTIRMLLTLMKPSMGTSLILGQNPRQNPEILRRVGFLVEGATFYPYLNGWDNLIVRGKSHGGFNADTARYLLGFVGLSQHAFTKVRNYSTGMKQRLGIAAALLNDPELVILDEPANGMDPAGIREIRQFVRRLAEEQRKTVFYSSHLLAEVQQTCDRVAIINQGTIVAEGTIDELLGQQSIIDFDVASVEKAKEAVQENWKSEPQAGGNILRVYVERNDIPKVVNLLVQNDIDIFGVTPYRQSLEEYFLGVTGSPGQQPMVPPQQQYPGYSAPQPGPQYPGYPPQQQSPYPPPPQQGRDYNG